MWRELGEIAQVSSGYPFRGKVISDPDGELVVLQAKELSELASLPPERLAEFVPILAVRVPSEDSHEKHMLQGDDVLVQVRGTQFKAVVFPGSYPAIAAQGVAILRPGGSILANYLCWALNHPKTTEGLRAVAGGSNIPFLSMRALTGFRVPVPPLDVQLKVVAADEIRRSHQAAARRLLDLNERIVDAVTWQAATETA